MKIRLVTVVWGKEYADTFLRTGLRTLIANGNCISLAETHDVVYTIYVSFDAVKLLDASPAYKLLRKHVNVCLRVFGPDEIDMTNYGSHGTLWNRELELARREGAVIFFIIPDVIYASNTLTLWAKRFEEGAGAIFTIGPQVALETIVPEIESRYPDVDAPCALSREELYDLLFRHFHPLHVAMRHDSNRRPSHPEYDLRLVPEHGFVIREIVSHPFCIYPRIFNGLRHYGPRDHLDSVVIEPCLTLSVEPIIKRVHGFYRPWPLDEVRLSNMAVWYNYYGVEACEYESAFTYDICANDPAWATARRRAVAGGRFFRGQIIKAGRLYRIFAELNQRRLPRAASILALAVYAGRLRRRLSVPKGATILVPSESAIEANAERLKLLLAPGNEKELIDLISDHIMVRKEDALRSNRLRNLLHRSGRDLSHDQGAIYTARGMPAETLVDRAVRTQAPFEVDEYTFIIIDRVLWRCDQPSTAAGSLESQSDRSEPVATDDIDTASEASHQKPPMVDVGPLFVPADLWRSRLKRAVFYAAHIPLIEPLIAVLFHRVYYPRVMRFLQFENRAYQFVRHLPRALFRRSRNILAPVPFLIWLRAVGARPTDRFYLVRRAVRAIRRDGTVAVLLRVLASRKEPTVATLDNIPTRKLELIDEIRSVRTIEACADVLQDLQTKMMAEEFRSAPLALLRKVLSDAKLDVGSSDIIERSLVSLTRTDSEWADPWLELGFLREDQGRLDDALICFSRAMAGKEAGKKSNNDPHSATVAAVHRGRLLASSGRDEEARQCFEFALSQDPGQRLAAVMQANTLRRLGQIDRALLLYSEGMHYQETRWSLPIPPRNVERLRFPRLTGKMREIEV